METRGPVTSIQPRSQSLSDWKRDAGSEADRLQNRSLQVVVKKRVAAKCAKHENRT